MAIRMEKFYTARIKGDDIRSFLDQIDQSEISADNSECSESPTGAHYYVSYPRRNNEIEDDLERRGTPRLPHQIGSGNNDFNCKYCGRNSRKDETGKIRKKSNDQLIQKIMEDGARFIERYSPEREWDTWNLSLMASQLISLNALATFSVYMDDAEIESEKTELYEDMMGFIKSLRSKMPDVKIRYEIWNFKIGPAIFNPG